MKKLLWFKTISTESGKPIVTFKCHNFRVLKDTREDRIGWMVKRVDIYNPQFSIIYASGFKSKLKARNFVERELRRIDNRQTHVQKCSLQGS